MNTGALAGAVLAGGESRRMGRDKALLRTDGEPLWRRQVRVLRTAGAEPVVIVRREGQPTLGRGVRHLRDGQNGVGPLAGLQAALAGTEARWLAVLAVDMPAIDATWFAGLKGHCRDGAGAVARHDNGFEPLAAIYPREALTIVNAQLERGERALGALIAVLVQAGRMNVVELSPAEVWRMENWNSPRDRKSRGETRRRIIVEKRETPRRYDEAGRRSARGDRADPA